MPDVRLLRICTRGRLSCVQRAERTIATRRARRAANCFVAGSREDQGVAYHEPGDWVVAYLVGATIKSVRIAPTFADDGTLIQRGRCQSSRGRRMPRHVRFGYKASGPARWRTRHTRGVRHLGWIDGGPGQ